MVAGAPTAEAQGEGDRELLRRCLPLLLKELPPTRVAAVAARLTGVPRDEIYAQLRADAPHQ